MPLNGAASGSSILSYIVPDGHRAVTVAVNEVAGVAGFITPQSRVDVVLTTPRPGASDKEDNISKVILQNVSVLASGQVTEQKDGKPVITPTVTLDLPPTDAEKLIVGAKKGSLQLLLRNVIDVAAIDTRGATVSQALGGVERPAPAARPVKVRTIVKVQKVHEKVAAAPAPAPKPAGFQMEIIKGSAKSKGEFAEE
jgi:pilus assembly protein CpaB